MKVISIITIGVLTGLLYVHPVFSQDQEREQQRVHQEATQQSGQVEQVENRNQVYGSELMTQQERSEHQEKLRNMKSEQEREAYQAQHHEEMKLRASEQGVELSDDMHGMNQGKGKGQRAANKSGPAMGSGRSGGSGGGKGK